MYFKVNYPFKTETVIDKNNDFALTHTFIQQSTGPIHQLKCPSEILSKL